MTLENLGHVITRRDFFVSLPAALGAVVSLKPTPQPTGRNQSRQRRSTWCRNTAPVWIVDDDAALGEVYELVLAPAGYATRIFQNRIEALRFLRQGNERPSLLITDFIGRPISADLFMQRFRNEHPQVKVLMATGWDQSCLESCVSKPDGFLQKPFDLQLLLMEVDALVSTPTI